MSNGDTSATPAGQVSSPRPKGVLIDGERVARERKSRGLSQLEFCSKFGLSSKIIKEVESNASRRIKPKILADIARALDLEPQELSVEFPPPRLLTTFEKIKEANLEIVREAKRFICTTGSRSRDNDYLVAIEQALAENPKLAHYRVLFDTPIAPQLLKHLRRLIEIRNAGADPRETISIGLYANDKMYPTEAAVCLNEKMALYVLPSITGAWRYDTAILFEDPSVIDGWWRWIEEMYRTGTALETATAISKLAGSET